MTTRVPVSKFYYSHNYDQFVMSGGESFYKARRAGMGALTNVNYDYPMGARLLPSFHIDRLVFTVDNTKETVVFEAAKEEFDPSRDNEEDYVSGFRSIFMTLEDGQFCMRINVWLEQVVNVIRVEPEVPIINGNPEHIYHLVGFSATNLEAVY